MTELRMRHDEDEGHAHPEEDPGEYVGVRGDLAENPALGAVVGIG